MAAGVVPAVARKLDNDGWKRHERRWMLEHNRLDGSAGSARFGGVLYYCITHNPCQLITAGSAEAGSDPTLLLGCKPKI